MAILQSTSITGSLEVTGSGTLLDLSSTTGSAIVRISAIENDQITKLVLNESIGDTFGGYIKYDSSNFCR